MRKHITSYGNKQIKVNEIDDNNKTGSQHRTICLLEKHLAFGASKKTVIIKIGVVKMGRISVAISDELEKSLRFKTIERFGGKKGDLSKAVEEAIQTWVDKEK